MYIVLNTIKLILLISFGLIYLFGLGWIIVSFILAKNLNKKEEEIRLIEGIPLAIASGLVINYGIALWFQTLQNSMIVGTIISLFGISHFAIYAFHKYKTVSYNQNSWNLWISVVFINLLFLGPILMFPLKAWDARSIWFFHAKMIFVADSIGQAAGWQHSSVIFSHPDYPKMLPILAAQIASVAGFWNGYLPKISLFIILVPAQIWLFSFARRTFSFFILIMLIPFSFNRLLWNGYMDGFLALYFAITVLFLGRYLRSFSKIDLLSSMGSLAIVLYLKNEGILAFLAIFSASALLLISLKKLNIKKIFTLSNWKQFLVGLLAISPFFTWYFYRKKWGILNDLAIGTPATIQQFLERLSDGSYRLIFSASYKELEVALLLLGFLFFASAIWSTYLPKESYPTLIAASFYYLGMISIYFLTPHNLSWHIGTSIERTMLPVNASLYVACYFILDSIENENRKQNL